MFEELRKRLSNAVKGFIKKEEKEVLKEEQQEGAKEERAPEKEQPKEQREEEQPAVDKKGKEEQPIKLSLKTKIKSVFLGTVRLSEPEIENFLETLKVSMLESDVSYGTTEQFVEDLHSKLKEKQIDSKRIREEITNSVRGSLFDVLNAAKGVNIDDFISERKGTDKLPVKILFLGPNGAGKTTTIAKIANHFKGRGVSIVLAASDTFRAAAIEQIEHHAKRVGVPVIKSTYGADPASIAFDAIAYAKAHKIELVLIDSAGRQETNKSLINEVQKIVRVSAPDLTVFVGESTSGNQIAEQIKEFNRFVKIDGIILTKLDCDAKGGGAISISHTTGIPILFFGVGEGYDALIPYNPDYIVDAILPESN